MPAEPAGKPLEVFVQREKKLQRWIWISVLVPLALFVGLMVMVSNELKTFNDLKKQVEANKLKIAAQKEELAKNDLALSAYQSQRSGEAPRIIYYRSSIGPTLIGALKQLGFNPTVEENVKQANPALAGKAADTLVYGCAVSEQDIRVIAAALIKAGIHIRRIVVAAKKPDPLLVQLVASPVSDPNQPDIDPATWKKNTPGCAAK
ncbi:MAG TPA: hypothetical protein VFQ41_19125 [Candidatus Angelobacter sp.]|nr:hypothetical protein [Candidatus Angelobacter sp.]